MDVDRFNYLIPLIIKRRKVLNSRYLHVAIILKGKKPITYAFNKVGSRSHGCGYNHMTLHAEIAVLKKFGNMAALKGLRLVVLRFSIQNKSWTLSHPCADCSIVLKKIMKQYGLHSVYYST